MVDAPPFDPSQPYEPVGAPAAASGPPTFDPSKPYDVVAKSPSAQSPGLAGGVARSFVHGIPIAGPLFEKANAAVNAAVSPYLDPYKDESERTPGATFADRYGNTQKKYADEQAAFEQEHPIASTVAEGAGSVAGFIPAAETALGARLLGLTGGSLASRTALSAATNAAIGGADAGVRGQDATRGALVGAATGVAAPLAGRAIGKAVEGVRDLVSPGAALPTAEQIGDAASKAYKAPEIAAVQFEPAAVKDLADSIRNDLQGKRINSRVAGQTHGLIDDMTTPINQAIDPVTGKPVPGSGTFGIEDLETTRRLLGDVAGNFTNKTDATAAVRAKQMIDNYLAGVPQGDLIAGDAKAANAALTKARADYATAQRMNTVAGKVESAENQAAVAHSGQNIDNATRQRINDILKSPSLRRGYSPEEIVAMQQVARGTAPGNILRFIGNLLGGGGGLGALASGGLAMSAGAGPAAAIVPAIGYGIKKVGNALTARNVDNLMNTIAAQAPSSASAVAARNAAEAARQARLSQMAKAGVLASRAATPVFGSLAPSDQ